MHGGESRRGGRANQAALCLIRKEARESAPVTNAPANTTQEPNRSAALRGPPTTGSVTVVCPSAQSIRTVEHTTEVQPG